MAFRTRGLRIAFEGPYRGVNVELINQLRLSLPKRPMVRFVAPMSNLTPELVADTKSAPVSLSLIRQEAVRERQWRELAKATVDFQSSEGKTCLFDGYSLDTLLRARYVASLANGCIDVRHFVGSLADEEIGVYGTGIAVPDLIVHTDIDPRLRDPLNESFRDLLGGRLRSEFTFETAKCTYEVPVIHTESKSASLDRVIQFINEHEMMTGK